RRSCSDATPAPGPWLPAPASQASAVDDSGKARARLGAECNRGAAVAPPEEGDDGPGDKERDSDVAEEVGARRDAGEAAAEGQAVPDGPRPREKSGQHGGGPERDDRVAARERKPAAVERPVGERAEDVLAAVRAGALASQQQLEDLAHRTAQRNASDEEDAPAQRRADGIDRAKWPVFAHERESRH